MGIGILPNIYDAELFTVNINIDFRANKFILFEIQNVKAVIFFKKSIEEAVLFNFSGFWPRER